VPPSSSGGKGGGGGGGGGGDDEKANPSYNAFVDLRVGVLGICTQVQFQLKVHFFD
jgi:hypothetical protein